MTTTIDIDDLPVFDMNAAADHLGITANTLRAYRFKRYPPDHATPFPEPGTRAGGTTPMWSRNQLDAWQQWRTSVTQ